MVWKKDFDNSVLPALINNILTRSEQMREIELELLSDWFEQGKIVMESILAMPENANTNLEVLNLSWNSHWWCPEWWQENPEKNCFPLLLDVIE